MKISKSRAVMAALAAIFAFTSTPALAFDWNVVGRVTIIESTYMPASIAFQIDASAGSCATGSWLTYQAVGDTASDKSTNAAATMAVLLTAMATGKTVRIFGTNASCIVDHIWIQQ